MATYEGDNRNNLYIGTDDPDLINGHGAIDLLRGGAGDDTINGGAGPDSLYGDQGADTIDGGDGDDLIRGGKGDDTLSGGNGNDIIRGDLGNDTLSVSYGRQFVFGDDGDDYIYGSSIWGAYVDGGPGRDTLDYSWYDPLGSEGFHFGWLDPSHRTVAVATRYGSGIPADRDLAVDVEIFILSAGDDWMTENQYPWDNAPRVEIRGGAGNDSLFGYGGDTLHGGEGDDWLGIHDSGTVSGGSGADIFWLFGEDLNGVEILDFSRDEGDQITLSSDGFSGVTEDDLQAMLDAGDGSDLDLSILNAPGRQHGTLTLTGVDVSELTVDDFILG